MSETQAASRAKRVAVIVTEYRFNSHADVILGRLLGDFDYKPRIQVASLYTDQVPDNDMSREAAERNSIPIYSTIEETIRYAHEQGGLDGVVIIGEHGDYPEDEKGRKHYPRRRLLEETLNSLDELELRIPIFSDKHFAYQIEDTVWMFEQLRKRGIPFLGGSSIPHAPYVPAFDVNKLKDAKEILVLSYSTIVEAYGYHGLELLQSLAEKRAGGETGVRSVSALEGEEVWEAMDRKEWPEDLLLSSLNIVKEDSGHVHPRERGETPWLFIVDYEDGTKGYVFQQNTVSDQWRFAFRDGQGEIVSAISFSELARPFGHFETLTRIVEDFVISGTEPFPAERVLMSSGLINYVMDALHEHKKLETPALRIHY